MKKPLLICLAIALPIVAASEVAFAHGRFNRFNFGINLGYPGYYGYGFYDPFLYSPFYSYPPVIAPMAPPVIIPSTPPVYIQQQEDPPAIQSQTNYWYYCQESNSYYPYVKQCPGGWLTVNPQPPAQ